MTTLSTPSKYSLTLSKGAGMRRLMLIAAAAVVAVAGFAMFNGCTGPQGPAGADGKSTRDTVYSITRDTVVKKDTVFTYDTITKTVTTIIRDTTHSSDTIVKVVKDTTVILDTILMSPSCAVCHGNEQTIVAKQREWEQSGHAAIETGNSFDYAGTRQGCMPCHNGSVYPLWVNGDTTTHTDLLNNAIGPNCRTCHQIHVDYDSTDWALIPKATDSVKLAAYANTFVDLGKGNLCVRCHQARGVTNIDTLTADSVKMFQRTQAHHGPQVQVVAGMGGYEFTNVTPAVSTAKDQSPHITAVKDGCVECHVTARTGQNHNFIPKIGACTAVGCHVGKTTFDIDSVQTKVVKLQTEIIDSLVRKGMVVRDPANVIGIAVPAAAYANTAKFPKAHVGAAYNLFVTVEDRSKGVHNGKYVLYLLRNSLEVLKR